MGFAYPVHSPMPCDRYIRIRPSLRSLLSGRFDHADRDDHRVRRVFVIKRGGLKLLGSETLKQRNRGEDVAMRLTFDRAGGKAFVEQARDCRGCH